MAMTEGKERCYPGSDQQQKQRQQQQPPKQLQQQKERQPQQSQQRKGQPSHEQHLASDDRDRGDFERDFDRLLVRHLPTQLSAEDQEDLLKHFGATKVTFCRNNKQFRWESVISVSLRHLIWAE